jgi:hypothetical protein
MRLAYWTLARQQKQSQEIDTKNTKRATKNKKNGKKAFFRFSSPWAVGKPSSMQSRCEADQ